MKALLTRFLRIGLAVAKAEVPAIGTVEMAVKELKAGKRKKENVLEIVKASPEILEFVKNGDIVDEALFAQGVDKVNDGYVDIMNALRRDGEPASP